VKLHFSNWTYFKFLVSVWATILVFNPGKVEGYLFPVVDRMELTKAAPIDEVNTSVWGRSKVERGNCSYRFIRWYLGKRGQIDTPAAITTGLQPLRHPGPFSFGPWFLNIPIRDVAVNSYADVFHRCKYFGAEAPWLTKTQFFN
jgi:hypothetical protein